MIARAVLENATRNGGLFPPSAGAFGQAVDGSMFFHLLPDLPTTSIYNKYAHIGSERATEIIGTYHSPLDRTNPGNDNSTSYASNAAFFGIVDGGSATITAFGTHGTSNTVLFMERFAQTGSGPRHCWGNATKPGRARPDAQARDAVPGANYVYAFANDPRQTGNVPDVVFGADPAALTDMASGTAYKHGARLDATAHGFTSMSCLVAFGDGHVQRIDFSANATAVTPQGSANPTHTIWSWLCCAGTNPLADAPRPGDW